MAIAVAWPAFLDALKEALEARPGLAGVTVSTAWIGEDGGLESIQFTDVEDVTEWGAIGNRRIDEVFEVTGFIFIAKDGAGEAVIKRVRDRATAILNELLQELRESFAQGTWQARLTGHTGNQGLYGQARACNIEFTIRVETTLTP